jgi:hypothetical protein
MSGGSGADVFIHRQDEDADNTINYILDWDSGDVIRLCGQRDDLFYVVKIEFQARDVDGVKNDVVLLLSDASKIIVKNAAHDFQTGFAGDGPGMNLIGANVDDFQFVAEFDPDHAELCFFDCPAPDVDKAPVPIDFCDDEA